MIFRRILCALSVLACAVLIGVHGGTASFMLFWASLLIPLFSFIYRRIISEKLRIFFRVSDHTALKGDRISCTLSLSNDSSFPIPDVRVRLTTGKVRFSGVTGELSYSLMPGETKELKFDLECLHCGSDIVGAELIRVQDIFALSEYHFREVKSIDILPRNRHLQDLTIAPVCEIERRRTGRTYFGNSIPDGQLRPYVSGDDIRRIHWKASALQGKPIMRSTVPEPKSEIVLLPDIRMNLPDGQAGWLCEDSVIEGTLVIADYFLRHNISIRVVPSRNYTLNVSTASDYMMLYNVCSTNFFSGSERPDSILSRDIAVSGGKSSYIIITWELDEAFIRRCSECIDLGSDVTVVYIGEDGDAKKLSQVERRLSFYQVTAQNDIFSVLSGTKVLEGAAE
jgi:hypothetical protein